MSFSYLFVHKIYQNVTKTWDQPYPPCPEWCSKKVQLVWGINISYSWVWSKQGCRGEVGFFQLKSGFAIRGQEIGLDLESSLWGCRLRGGCHLKGAHDAVSAVFVSKHSKVRNPRDDGLSLLNGGKKLFYHTKNKKMQPWDKRVSVCQVFLYNSLTPLKHTDGPVEKAAGCDGATGLTGW